jgi:hypothetical protein
MQIPIFALSMMAYISFSTAFHHGGNPAYQIRSFKSKTISSLADKACFGYTARTKNQGVIMNLKSDCSSSPNNVLIRFLGLASFAMLSSETMAQAFVPDLSGSPLKNAQPTIVVEGVPRIVDGIRHSYSVNFL